MKGIFRPKNPQKYNGDPRNIVYRSSWELKLMMRLDSAKNVIWWSSEEMSIPYVSPLDDRIHRYYPDFIVHRINTKTKKPETIMIEVKPHKETLPPKRPTSGKPTRRFLTEVATYGKNQAKWKAARKVCQDKGWKFVIMTEHELGLPVGKKEAK